MTAPVFERDQPVRFGHCDPAGIVFYPRYFEMLNAFIEDWFAQVLGLPFDGLIGQRGIGMPTARLDTRFLRVSRHGDLLRQQLHIERLGGASLTLRIAFTGRGDEAGGPRVEFTQVLVCTSLATHRPQAFPDDLRAALERARIPAQELHP